MNPVAGLSQKQWAKVSAAWNEAYRAVEKYDLSPAEFLGMLSIGFFMAAGQYLRDRQVPEFEKMAALLCALPSALVGIVETVLPLADGVLDSVNGAAGAKDEEE